MRYLIFLVALLPLAVSAEIPENTWVDVEATAAMGPLPSETDGAEPDFRAFSSMEATDDGRIIYWGGGHGNYGGNDMDVYHVQANEWRQETEEENWKERLDGWDHLGTNGQPSKELVRRVYGSGGVADYLTGRGRPGTRHVYQQQTWWPEKGWFVFDYKHSLWAWDPDQGDANGAFIKINDTRANQGQDGIHYWNIAHDPPTGQLISFNSSTNSAYRLADGSWQKIMDLGFSRGLGEVYSEYHTAEGAHYVAKWNNLRIVDLDAGTVEAVPDSPPSVAGNNAMWFEYAPSREQMLVMGHDAAGQLGLWGYARAEQTWQRIPMEGEVLKANGNPISPTDMRWDMLERDPISGNFYFLAIDKGRPFQGPPTYAFRLPGAEATAAPSDPSPHPSNEWVSLPIPGSPAGLPKGHGKDFQIEWRSVDGHLYIGFGDWHQNDGSSINGNQHLIGLDPETNEWWIEHGACTGDPQPDGWDEVATAYDSRRDELWGFPGYGWADDGSCATDIGSSTMAYGFESGRWRETGHGHLYQHDDIGFGGYDPVTDRFYVAQRPGVDEINPDDPDAGITDRNPPDADYHVGRNQAFLDVAGRAFYLTARNRGELIRFGLDDHTFRSVTTIPEGTITSNAYASWDPNHRVVLAPIGNMESGKPASSRVHVYHVDLALWQIIDYPDDGTTPFGNSVGYDVDSQLLVQMGTKSWPEMQSVFALEYSPEATGEIEPWVTGDTPVPEPVPVPEIHTIAITGTGPEVEYVIEFEGAPAKNGEAGSINEEDVIDGTTVTGYVVEQTDAYDYTGHIVSCVVAAIDDVTVSVDGAPYEECATRVQEPTPEPDPSPEPAQQITLTRGLCEVVVGDKVVSEHRQDKEALESAVNQMLAGATRAVISCPDTRVEWE